MAGTLEFWKYFVFMKYLFLHSPAVNRCCQPPLPQESHSQHHTSDHSGHRESEPEVRRSKSKPQVTVLNEGGTQQDNKITLDTVCRSRHHQAPGPGRDQ